MGDQNRDDDQSGSHEIEDIRGAEVLLPPPLFPVVAILLGVVLGSQWPLIIPEGALIYWLGRALALAGLVVIIHVGMRFSRAKTDIRPHKPTSTILTDGIFGRTRNPIYLSFLVLQLAVALILNNYWIIIAIPLTMAGLDLYVIRREERYLSQKFGLEYADYKSEVRRWL